MATFILDDKQFLLVVASKNKTAVLVDLATSRTVTVALPLAFDQLMTYARLDGTPEALLWKYNSQHIATMSLSTTDAATLASDVSLLAPVSLGIDQQVQLEDGRIAFIGRKPGITLVNAIEQTVTPYSAQTHIERGLLDEQRQRAWIVPSNAARVGYLDLATGATDEVVLDAAIVFATLIPDADRIALIHNDPLGHITFVDLDTPTRNTSQAVRGFLLEEAFQ